MNAIISPAPTRGSLDPMVRRPALRAGPGWTGHALRQAGTFAAIGVVSTLAYVALYALLRPAVPAELANAAALLATAIGNTAANRRLTFSIRGRAGLARDHAAGLLALGAALAITSAALAVLQVAAPGAPQAIEVAVLVAANAAATLSASCCFGRPSTRGDHASPRQSRRAPSRPARCSKGPFDDRHPTDAPGLAPPAAGRAPRHRPGPDGRTGLGSRRLRRGDRARRGPVPLEPGRQRLREHVLLGRGARRVQELVRVLLRLVRRGQLHHGRQAARRRSG